MKEQIIRDLCDNKISLKEAIDLSHKLGYNYNFISELKRISECLNVQEIADAISEDDWLNEAQPVAPPKPIPVKPETVPSRPSRPEPFRPPQPKTVPKPKAVQPMAPTKPAPSIPKPETQPNRPTHPDPFRPPQPKTVPKPKAQTRNQVIEMFSHCLEEQEYETEVHPATREFWSNLPKNKQHLFSKHPILAMHGDKLSKDAYQFTSEKMAKHKINIENLQSLVMQILRIESQHKDELVNLAKNITVKIWGAPKDMLDAKLTNEIGDSGPSEPPKKFELPEKLRKQINKRITMNALTQGSAVHAMISMHHLVDKEINKISPELLDLYNKIAIGSVHHYWLIDIPALIAFLKFFKAGESVVTYGENKEPMIVARAVVFPVLCQELSKGVMELISHHGLANLDERETETVLHFADVLEDEPWLIQIGPALWRRFLKVIPKKINLANLITALSIQEPDEVHKIINAVIEKPEEAIELLQELMSDPKEFDIEEY